MPLDWTRAGTQGTAFWWILLVPATGRALAAWIANGRRPEEVRSFALAGSPGRLAVIPVSDRIPLVEMWEWRSRINRAATTYLPVGAAAQFPPGFLRPASESDYTRLAAVQVPRLRR